MARLNELPAPAESIEALKRRFVRQNREIARANSIQSLRIQSLESEVSHLLRENAALREQVISLSQDVEKFEAARSLSNEICTYKDKLASKLAELGSLVDELGMMPQKFRKVSEHRKGSGTERRQSCILPPKRMAIGPDGGEEDGRLPVILEDKYFPRRTLESQEVEAISNTTTDPFDSPKIGSPPIAHLDVDQSLSPESLTGDAEFTRPETVDNEEPDSPLPARLDAKSTGKESSFLTEVSQAKHTTGASKSEIAKPAMKSGSKRKFSARDDDDKFLSNTNIIDDDFQFSRAINISQKTASQTGPHNPEESFDSSQNNLTKPLKNARTSRRKVLEPKSTNMRPMSPRKQPTADVESQKKHIKRDNHEENMQKDALIQTSQQLDPGSKPESENPDNNGGRIVSSETPSAPETCISGSVKDSSSQVESNDSSRQQTRENTQTAPSTTGPASRQTRRPRPAISYAEPNLRDKMRRPTDELVDAVVPDRFRRISSSQAEKNNHGNEEQDIHVSKAKTRTTSGTKGDSDISSSSSAHKDATRETAASSEDVKFHSLSELPTTVITERKRRTLSANKDDLIRSQDCDVTSGSSAHTVMPGGRKAPDRKHRGVCNDNNPDTAQISAERSSNPEISNETEITPAAGSTDKLPAGTVRHTRRHSSNTGSVYRDACFGDGQFDDHQRQKSLESDRKLSGHTQTSKGTIHQMENEVGQFNRKEQDGGEISFNEIAEHAKDNSEDSMNTAADGGQIKRSQRGAARRRSMML